MLTCWFCAATFQGEILKSGLNLPYVGFFFAILGCPGLCWKRGGTCLFKLEKGGRGGWCGSVVINLGKLSFIF